MREKDLNKLIYPWLGIDKRNFVIKEKIKNEIDFFYGKTPVRFEVKEMMNDMKESIEKIIKVQ